ncbi:hypothetical protein F0562_022428 [Nyssa sinensis]|uniref:Uncharacterized protein n=1 Tax=Nyssa sinensis TaxID=561372 RepID=A0A5J5BNX2_9ASTE|nr:hypothetical protein F0562_022428 [Nyssa sinensis]
MGNGGAASFGFLENLTIRSARNVLNQEAPSIHEKNVNMDDEVDQLDAGDDFDKDVDKEVDEGSSDSNLNALPVVGEVSGEMEGNKGNEEVAGSLASNHNAHALPDTGLNEGLLEGERIGLGKKGCEVGFQAFGGIVGPSPFFYGT